MFSHTFAILLSISFYAFHRAYSNLRTHVDSTFDLESRPTKLRQKLFRSKLYKHIFLSLATLFLFLGALFSAFSCDSQYGGKPSSPSPYRFTWSVVFLIVAMILFTVWLTIAFTRASLFLLFFLPVVFSIALKLDHYINLSWSISFIPLYFSWVASPIFWVIFLIRSKLFKPCRMIIPFIGYVPSTVSLILITIKLEGFFSLSIPFSFFFLIRPGILNSTFYKLSIPSFVGILISHLLLFSTSP